MEQEMVEFSILSHEPTNQDLSVTLTPHKNVMRYEYEILLNGEVTSSRTITTNRITTLLLDETGNYQIKVTSYDYYNKKTVIESGIYQLDKEAPIIEVTDTLLEMKIGDTLLPMEGVKAYDKQDGDLLKQVTTNYDQLDFQQTGVKNLVYTVSDEAGNVTTQTVYIRVEANDTIGVMLIQIAIIIALVGAIIAVAMYRRSMNLEKRIGKFAIDPIKDNSLSLFDLYHMYYQKFIQHTSACLAKSTLLKKYAVRYEKYVGIIGKHESGLDYVSNKLVVSLMFLLIAIFSATIQLHFSHFYELVLPMLLGFFFPDILYFSKYRIHRSHIENDLLQAIIIMNNAFKSGRSIIQAIELVATELEGSIAEEFKKMRMELSFGLSVDVVFERFANRIQLEEVTYLTASLSILNQTGGNIIKVFSSIEQSLFNKKKLKLEMLSLTGSSKMIFYVLCVMPFLFIIFVSMISPDYFLPFLTTKLGLLLLAFLLCYYIVFVFVVKKIMKVRM